MEAKESLYGPAQSLSYVVSEYCLTTYNDRRKHYMAFLIHARYIWKKLFWNTLLRFRSKYYFVDKTCLPYQLIYPKDAVRIMGVSVDDECGKLTQLLREDRLDTTLKATAKKVCPSCGEDPTIQSCINQISLVTKDVVIAGGTYQEQIWSQVCANGDVLEMRRVPVQDFVNGGPNWQITYIDKTTTIAKLELSTCGCVKNTNANNSIIQNSCNCPAFTPFFNRTVQLVSAPYQKYGVVKFDDKNRIIYLSGNVPDQVCLTFQTNGECDAEEIMIPDYAHEALTFGMHWRAGALAPNVNRIETIEREKMYNKEVSDLREFLDPVMVAEWMDNQMALPKWGNAGTGETLELKNLINL